MSDHWPGAGRGRADALRVAVVVWRSARAAVARSETEGGWTAGRPRRAVLPVTAHRTRWPDACPALDDGQGAPFRIDAQAGVR